MGFKLKVEAVSYKNRALKLTNGEISAWIPASASIDLRVAQVGATHSFEITKDMFGEGKIIKAIGPVENIPDESHR